MKDRPRKEKTKKNIPKEKEKENRGTGEGDTPSPEGARDVNNRWTKLEIIYTDPHGIEGGSKDLRPLDHTGEIRNVIIDVVGMVLAKVTESQEVWGRLSY